MASDYPGRTVLVGFFIERQDAGSAAQRQQFADDLFEAFDAHIVAAAAAETRPFNPTPRIRASIALMAQHATGSTNKIKARRAVAAYVVFRGL